MKLQYGAVSLVSAAAVFMGASAGDVHQPHVLDAVRCQLKRQCVEGSVALARR